MFDPVTYFQDLTERLKLSVDNGYSFRKISGITNLEGILSGRKEAVNFIAVDDGEDGVILKGGGGGYFKRRPYTIFICSAVKIRDMEDRETKLEQHRSIFHSFMTKIITDRSSGENLLGSWDPTRTPFYEIDERWAGGCIGIFFMISLDNPINLTYQTDDWYIT